ncbi:MAG: cell division protein FtsK [Actinomycetales bacterium]|nr:cell division protein FtsK [Actinomycetales bacterium]
MLDVAESLVLGQRTVPLFGAGNIWVEDSVLDRTSLGLTQQIMARALEDTQPGQLELIVFDDSLSGISAPFEALNAGREKVLTVTHDTVEFAEHLAYLRDHIQSVNNVMQGLTSTLVEFRKMVNYPVEGYKLVVLSTDVSMLSEDLQNDLSTLLRAGPRAGVSFLIHSVKLGVEYLAEPCEVVSTRQGMVVPGGKVDPRALIESATSVSRSMAQATMLPIRYSEIEDSGRWEASSADGITFAIGRYGLSTVHITLGDELNQRHNVLITGAVGQGKSNLISVMIHSLCQRYSPTELELVLLDFKEGVTLQGFYGSEGGEYLPHARVLGLESDREFGQSVFQHLFNTYRSRMATFKAAGVQNIAQYRAAEPGSEMPRVVVIIDEFQMMFADNDRLSAEIADLLVQGARLFRACGIHIVLASQTIGGNVSLMGSAGEGLFGQFPVRIALKNSLSESHATLGSRNDAAAHLRAREAIVNVDYGQLSANRKTTIAFADEQVMRELRRDWWMNRPSASRAPYVFEGDRVRSLRDDLAVVRGLVSAGGDRKVMLGQRIGVDGGPLALPFGREVGRNIVVLGGGPAVPMVLNAALALCLQPRQRRLRFVVLDCTGGESDWARHRDSFVRSISGRGHQVEVVAAEGVDEAIGRLAGPGPEMGSPADEDVYVLALGLERRRAMPMEFQDLIQTGSARGVHLIAWWRKFEVFREHVGYGGESYFDIKVALRSDAQTVRQFFNDPLLAWKAADNRALVWDATELDEPTRTIPYAQFDPIGDDLSTPGQS